MESIEAGIQTMVRRMYAMLGYAVGTVLMVFGWLCALAQGDGPPQHPRIAGLVAIFALASAFLTATAISLWRWKRGIRIVFLGAIGIQVIVCLYAIVAEFML